MSRNFHQDSRQFAAQMYREGKFLCDICLIYWPITSMTTIMTREGLAHVSTLCGDTEPDGDVIERDIRRAEANELAAVLTEKEMQPPHGPDGDTYPGIVELPAQSIIATVTPFPVVLVHGGPSVSVVLDGVGFSATDVLSYGAAGITDALAPVLTSSTPTPSAPFLPDKDVGPNTTTVLTRWTLSLQASNATPPGSYAFTFNSDVFPAAFAVH